MEEMVERETESTQAAVTDRNVLELADLGGGGDTGEEMVENGDGCGEVVE